MEYGRWLAALSLNRIMPNKRNNFFIVVPQVSLTLGVGDYYPLLASMLTNRPWGDVVGAGTASSRLRERNTAADRAQIRGYAQQYLAQIVHVLECV